jgi:hypothetical protein
MVAFIIYDPPEVGEHKGEWYWCLTCNGETQDWGWFNTVNDLPYEWMKTSALMLIMTR